MTIYLQLSAGEHTFYVRAVDAFGNHDPTSASFTWTVDTTAPNTSIDSATDGNNNPVTGGGTTNSDSITFTFSGTPPEDVNHFECSIDGGAFATCTVDDVYTLPDGQHTFAVRRC